MTASEQAYQVRVQPWLLECFGPTIAADRIERHHRFLEEALELVQATGCTADEAHELVRYVYSRPTGDINQEVGGVMVTLAALCLAHGLDMHTAGESELARVWTKVEQIRAKQAAKPKYGPLPAQQQPGASGYGPHVYLPDSRAGDECAGCGQARADPTHVWPGASERGEKEIRAELSGDEIYDALNATDDLYFLLSELESLRTRLADAERKAKDWETAAGAIMVTNVELVGQMDAAQREAQALRDAFDQCLIGGNHIASVLISWHADLPRDTPYTDVLEALGVERYEVWCCWKAIMDARDSLREALASMDRGES